MNQKHYHVKINVNLMEENVIQVNGGITMNTGVSVKKIIYVKKTMFEILLHVIVKIGNISKYYG